VGSLRLGAFRSSTIIVMLTAMTPFGEDLDARLEERPLGAGHPGRDPLARRCVRRCQEVGCSRRGPSRREFAPLNVNHVVTSHIVGRVVLAGFEGWCASRGLCSCPAPPATVAVYLAALADADAAVATIEKTLAAIAHERVQARFASRRRSSRNVVEKLLRGQRRARTHRRKRPTYVHSRRGRSDGR
jgi:hypothetical protein